MTKVFKFLKMIGQGVILWLIFWLGGQISLVSGLPIPGSIFGMVLLFLLLLCGVIKIEYIQETADFLIKHMMFFFITIAVGLINSAEIFYEYGVVLTVALVVSLILPLATVGLIVQISNRRENKCSH